MAALPPFAATSGPRKAKLMLVGEAWGEQEELLRKPFVGYSGKELWLMLGEAMPTTFPQEHLRATAMHRYGNAWVKHREEWLEAASISMTNVLAFRPPANKLAEICVPRAELPAGGKGYPLPALVKGKYLPPIYFDELERLKAEIAETEPNLVVALGATACWALLHTTTIGLIRGTIFAGEGAGRAVKVLPTWHPQFVNYQWKARAIVVADLMKASREAAFGEVRRPSRQILIRPQIAELRVWIWQTLLGSPPSAIACDVETKAGQISCLSFARAPNEALVIPFFDPQSFASYWTEQEEQEVWRLVARVLESPIPKVGHNFLYDLQYITRMGICPRNVLHDTMLLHHSLFPELRKSLGFLGSIYTSEPAWKLMRREKADTVKRDE